MFFIIFAVTAVIIVLSFDHIMINFQFISRIRLGLDHRPQFIWSKRITKLETQNLNST